MPIKVIEEQNKVVLTQAQFEAVKGYLGSYMKANLVMNVATQEFSADNPLYQIPFDSLLVAIYRPEDIIIEQTVEEQLFEKYENVDRYTEYGWSKEDAFQNGIYAALDIIGMKVKGINA